MDKHTYLKRLASAVAFFGICVAACAMANGVPAVSMRPATAAASSAALDAPAKGSEGLSISEQRFGVANQERRAALRDAKVGEKIICALRATKDARLNPDRIAVCGAYGETTINEMQSLGWHDAGTTKLPTLDSAGNIVFQGHGVEMVKAR